MCIKGGKLFQLKAQYPSEAMWKLDAAAIPGDTIVFHRSSYSHYGIYICDNWIIDFSDPKFTDEVSVNSEKMSAEARWRSVPEAVRSSTQIDIYYCCQNVHCNCRQITVSRAIQFVEQAEKSEGDYSKGKYSLLYNNCEHFCFDCVHHQRYSSQSIKGTHYGIAPVATLASSTVVGASAGAGLGFAGGPFAPITVPFGAGIGAVIGLATGLTSSMAAGGIAHGVKWNSLVSWCSDYS